MLDSSLSGNLEGKYPMFSKHFSSRRLPLLLTYKEKTAEKGVFDRVQEKTSLFGLVHFTLKHYYFVSNYFS